MENNLRKCRIRAGYSQVKVARLLGIKNSNEISRWEKGVFFPNIKNLVKLGILYNTPLDDLYPHLRGVCTAELSACYGNSGRTLAAISQNTDER